MRNKIFHTHTDAGLVFVLEYVQYMYEIILFYFEKRKYIFTDVLQNIKM